MLTLASKIILSLKSHDPIEDPMIQSKRHDRIETVNDR
jgi:hypothetical protein